MTFDDQPTMPGSARPPASLVVRQGTQAGVTFPLSRDQLIIGRQEGVDIVLQDAEVSRRHAQLSWQANAFVIHDLGSTNGVFVNGIEIAGPHSLQNGDSVRLGQTTLILQMAGLEAPSGSPGMAAGEPVPASYEEMGPERDDNRRRWLMYGCGCLALLCVCAALALAVAYATGTLNNVQVFNNLFGALVGLGY